MEIVFRTDASHEIGIGHAMRCLTLAHTFKRHGHASTFVFSELPFALESSISNDFGLLKIDGLGNGNPEDVDATNSILAIKKAGIQPDWVVVDHYKLGIQWESRFSAESKYLMVIDDLANREHECDLILDQGYYADPNQRYADNLSNFPIRLLGPKYSLLRSEFSESPNENAATKVSRANVSYGGTDPTSETEKVLSIVGEFKEIEFDFVVGANNPRVESLTAQIEKLPNAHLHVQSNEIGKLLAQSDLAFGAGGISTWERLCSGVPSLVTTVADNQVPSIEVLDKQNVVHWLGNSSEVNERLLRDRFESLANDFETREQMISAGRVVVDGKGAQRVSWAMEAFEYEVNIRIANSKDCQQYYDWANDPEVRRQSFSSEEIKFENHLEWFERRLKSDSSYLFVGEHKNVPIGQVRFEKADDSFTISYSIDQRFRGRGYAMQLLRNGLIKLNYLTGASTIFGETRIENCPSADALMGVGFIEIEGKDADSRRFKFDCCH